MFLLLLDIGTIKPVFFSADVVNIDMDLQYRNVIAFRNGRGSSNQSSDSEGSTHDLIGPGASRGTVIPGCGLFTGVPIVESIDYEAKKLLATKGTLDYSVYMYMYVDKY